MTPGKLVRGASLLAALCASSALAQSQTSPLPAFDLERLELNPDGRGSLFLGTGELLDAGQVRVSLLGHYERNPLAYYGLNERLGTPVANRATAELVAAYAPTGWLELGAQVPMVVYQTGSDLSALGVSPAAKSGLGTPVVNARLGLLSQRTGGPLDLALELGVGLPVGSAAVYGREPSVRYEPKLMLGRDLGPMRLGAQVGAQFKASTVLNTEAATVQDEVGRQVRGGISLSTTGEGLRAELDVLGDLSLTRSPNGGEVLLGVRQPLGTVAELFGAVGAGFGQEPGIPLWRALLGVAFGGARPAHKPLEELISAPVVRCSPSTPHTPAECPDLDDDGDGVKNGQDACPTEPGPAANQGCPVKAPPPPPPDAIKDSDGDGIADDKDKCPNEPGPLENGGCPVKDTDGDGVPDDKDKCPNEPGPADNQGCPKKQVVTAHEKLVIKGKVLFDSNKSKLQKRFNPLLNQAAKVLREHPEIPAVSIDGHSDKSEKNKKLSQARADAVRAYLIEQGVAPERLKARGHGSDEPADTSRSAKARASNRRVEFIISTEKTDQGPAESSQPSEPSQH